MVESHWKAAANLRSNNNYNNRNTLLSQIFEKWPILNHPMGWLLILQDFQYLELNAEEDAISQWPQFFQKIQQICPLDKKKILRVQELLQIIESDESNGMLLY